MCATIRTVPRYVRPIVESDITRALDAKVRTFNTAQEQMERARDELKAAIVDAVRVHNIPASDVARLTGYTREHVSRLVNAAPPPKRRRKKATPADATGPDPR